MLCLLPLLLGLSGFFSGSETAFFSLSPHQHLQLRRSDSIVAASITRLLGVKRSLLVTLLSGNTLVNVLYFVISTVVFLGLHERAVLGATAESLLNILALVLLILLGEVLPKLVASQHAMGWARITGIPLLFVHRLLSPLHLAFRRAVIEPLSRLAAPRQQPVELTPQELERLLDLSQQQGVIDDREEQLLQQVLSLGQLKVRDLMCPRVDIMAFDLDDPPSRLVDMAKRSRLSRFPAYRRDLDQIMGVIYGQQVLMAQPKRQSDVEALIRPVTFLPELLRADQLLVDLRERKTSLVIVVDEYGGTAGLVTLEDVVEKMVGQIAHPHEPIEPPRVQALGPGRWRVSAALGIREWSSLFGAVGPLAGVSTIGGLVMARLGHVPSVGDQTTVGNLSIQVESMSDRRVDTLFLELDGMAADTAIRPDG